MLIPDTHNIKIRFKIYNNTPTYYMNRWFELKKCVKIVIIKE